MPSKGLVLVLLLLMMMDSTEAQKLAVVIVDGFGGNIFHRFSHLPGFRTFEDEGVWSTKLFPVYPSLPLPNRHSLLTGRLPRRHGIIDDFIYNHRTGQTFANFSQNSDFEETYWWGTEPIYITATKAKASVAMFFFPECNVGWEVGPISCMPPRDDGLTFADEVYARQVADATKTHDLVMVYHPDVRGEISRIGPNRMTVKNGREIDKFQQSLERLVAQARERIDLNVVVISTHGMTGVPRSNIRVLDDYIPMELLNITVGGGALKQVIAKNGKTHQVYSQLRNHHPIPNVKIYYTASRIGDMPEWYHYKRSATVADLLLVAQPGYAIVTRDPRKQFPQESHVPFGLSGYNNQYPDMMGVFLAYGPMFKKGYRKGPIELCDIYHLMCKLLRLNCEQTPKRIERIDDVLSTDARVAIRTSSTVQKLLFFPLVTVFSIYL